MLHHLTGPTRAGLFQRLAAWLETGGWLYARDPNVNGLLRRAAGAVGLGRSEFHSPDERPLNPSDIVGELKSAGFDRLVVDYTDVMGGPLPWVLPSSSSALWGAVFAFDRAWLATPGLRRYASQFSVTGRRRG